MKVIEPLGLDSEVTDGIYFHLLLSLRFSLFRYNNLITLRWAANQRTHLLILKYILLSGLSQLSFDDKFKCILFIL